MQQQQPKQSDRSPARAKRSQRLFARSRALFAIVSNSSHSVATANTLDLQIQAIYAKIGQNRHRIERIHRQNILLSKQLAQINERQQSLLTNDLETERRSDIRLQKNNSTNPAKPVRRNINWIWLALVIICTALLCGTIGFAIARAISQL